MERIESIIEEVLPEAKVYACVDKLLSEANGIVGLDSGEIVVPPDTVNTIIFRRIQGGLPEFVFVNVLVAMVAIGGIQRVDPVPKAKYCFMRLFFDFEGS